MRSFFLLLILFIPQSTYAIGGKFTVVEATDPIAASAVAIIRVNDEGFEEQVCSGVYVALQKVLTAAHCVELFHSFDFYVYFTRDLKSRENLSAPEDNPNAKRITSVYVPETYRKDSFQDDYAVLTFKGIVPNGYRPVPILSRTVVFKPAIMQKEGNKLNIRGQTRMTIAGFSNTGTEIEEEMVKPDSGVLRKIETFYFMKSPSFQGSFLTGPVKEGRVVVGDSGGPVYVEEDGELYLVGLVSAFVDRDFGEVQLITDIRFLQEDNLLK